MPTASGPTATTRVAGVIGDPVRHSLSPPIHNAAFRALDLDWVYLAFPVPAGAGADAVAVAVTAAGPVGIDVESHGATGFDGFDAVASGPHVRSSYHAHETADAYDRAARM